MGLIVNKPAPELSFADLLAQLKIQASADLADTPVHFGGPVEHGRGFVLHSAEYSVQEFEPLGQPRLRHDRDGGHPAGHGARRRPGALAAGARLRRLGAGAARGRDPGQRLADGAGRIPSWSSASATARSGAPRCAPSRSTRGCSPPRADGLERGRPRGDLRRQPPPVGRAGRGAHGGGRLRPRAAPRRRRAAERARGGRARRGLRTAGGAAAHPPAMPLRRRHPDPRAARRGRSPGSTSPPRRSAPPRGWRRSLASRGAPASCACNLYDAPAAVGEAGGFDLAFVTWGAITWLPDIRGWARVVAHFLRPGGRLYLAEGHPAALVFDDLAAGADGMPGWFAPYFGRAPIEIDEADDYANREAVLENTREIGFLHPLGDVVAALGRGWSRHPFPARARRRHLADVRLPRRRRGRIVALAGPPVAAAVVLARRGARRLRRQKL